MDLRARPVQAGESVLTVKPSGGIRLTWQATPRNKFGFSAEPQNRHWILDDCQRSRPRCTPTGSLQHESFTTASWTSPVTNRLLLDARWANHAEGSSTTIPRRTTRAGSPSRFARQTTGFLYRSEGLLLRTGLRRGAYFGTQDAPFIQQMQASMTYVTGAHAIKVGFQDDWGTPDNFAARQRVRALL